MYTDATPRPDLVAEYAIRVFRGEGERAYFQGARKVSCSTSLGSSKLAFAVDNVIEVWDVVANRLLGSWVSGSAPFTQIKPMGDMQFITYSNVFCIWDVECGLNRTRDLPRNLQTPFVFETFNCMIWLATWYSHLNLAVWSPAPKMTSLSCKAEIAFFRSTDPLRSN